MEGKVGEGQVGEGKIREEQGDATTVESLPSKMRDVF